MSPTPKLRTPGGRWAATRLLAVVGVIALLASGCGTGATTPNSGSSNDAATPKRGGTLTVGTYGEMYGLDPVKADQGLLGGSQALAVYDSLMRLDDKGVPRPYLAESLTPNTDLTVWTMKLRSGVNFSDGTPLNADAVVFNVKRHLDPANASRARANLNVVNTVVATDPLTVTFTLKTPFASFGSLFCDQPGWIASPTAVQKWGKDYNTHPVGAGPFVFESWTPDAQLVLNRNPNYWQKDLPYLDKLVFRPIPDGVTRLASLKSGDIQVGPSIDAPEFKQAKADSNLSQNMIVSNGGQGIIINVAKVTDVRIRQAMMLAMDKNAINTVVFDGAMPFAHGPFSPDKTWANPNDGGIWPDFNLAEAKKLMEQVKTDTGQSTFTYSLMCSNNPARTKLAQLIQDMYKQIGITININMVDVTKVVSLLTSHDFDLGCHTVNAFDDPVPLLQQQFQTGQPRNYSSYSNPKVDAAFKAAEATTDLTAQKAQYKIVNQQLGTDLPYLFYANSLQGTIFRKNVHLDKYYGELKFYSAAAWLS
ncbi:MAG: peptide/nickel transport system substrate-binding protein [Micromonosporaceae bacterium]|jgi:peptide/nickel transport system substrate-binding protein|nr:peptide/nickel transport system substrate-binding protein [Micromonosporaceae bacterium]